MQFVNNEGGRHKFFNVWPYMKPLRAWIERRKRRPYSINPAPGESLRKFAFDKNEILNALTSAPVSVVVSE